MCHKSHSQRYNLVARIKKEPSVLTVMCPAMMELTLNEEYHPTLQSLLVIYAYGGSVPPGRAQPSLPFPFFILLGPLRGLIFLLLLGIFTARVARIKRAFSTYSDVSCNDEVDTA